MTFKAVTADELWRTPEDIDVLVMCAVRYALGRRTYIAAMVCDILMERYKALSEQARDIIIRDIEEARDRNRLGDVADARRWMNVLELLKQ